MIQNKKKKLLNFKYYLIAICSGFILLLLLLFSIILVFYGNPKNGLFNSIGNYSSIIGIFLTIIIFYLSAKSQHQVQLLSEEIHSLSIMAYKNQSLQLLLDNHLKSPKETKERLYWHYRFSFENYETLRLKLENNELLTIKIIGTNIAPFQPPAENIITYMYSVEIINTSDYRLPLGDAYCSFTDSKNKISLMCNQLDLISPMFEFEIIGPDILHHTWIEKKPTFYNRLINLQQYKSKDHNRTN